MQNENKKKRFAGKGYYIALIACIAAVGISGYVFVKTARDSAVETVATATVSPAVTAEAEEKTENTSKVETGAKVGEATASTSPAASASTETDQMEDAYEETMAEADVDPVVTWPLVGEVIATFSQDTLSYSQTMEDWRTHEGLDIAAEAGALVSATQDGTVTAVYEDDYLGNVVVVSHSGDLATLYANLADSPAVAVGDTVTAGQTLGEIGNTALLETAEPDHLHFEVFQNGNAMDPMEYLPD